MQVRRTGKPDRRSPEAQAYRHWYWTARWRRTAKRFLREHPLCCYCEQEGRVTAATVVDHKIPHRGNIALFWDEANWQPMCRPHHDGAKAREERGSVQVIGEDGWPT
jgi:5-methylcytosine-specific restriction endonuclease McrA